MYHFEYDVEITQKAFVYNKWTVTSALFVIVISFGGQSDYLHGGNI